MARNDGRAHRRAEPWNAAEQALDILGLAPGVPSEDGTFRPLGHSRLMMKALTPDRGGFNLSSRQMDQRGHKEVICWETVPEMRPPAP